jgi:predicted DCC family thiol-disulfide oxidoreductase YuxK
MSADNNPITDTADKGILLFDGVCNLCDGLVQFVLRRDAAGYFRFAALQSETGQRLLREHQLPDDMDTMIFIENGKAYTRSSAALRVFRRLGKAWPVLFALLYPLPAPLRDLGYKLIAKNRYRLFGKKDSCMMPTPEIRARFLT